MSAPPHLLLAWIGLAIAALTDLSVGRIPNWLTAPMMAAGILTHALTGDAWVAVIGLGGAFAVHYLLWMAGVVKAGDAKLMMGLGACLGVSEMLEATLWWLLLSLPVGLLTLAARGRLANLWATMRATFGRAIGRAESAAPEPTMMVAGPLIAVAGAIASLTEWLAVPELR